MTTHPREYHNSTDSDALSGGLSTGLNQCGKLEKPRQRESLGPRRRFQGGFNYFAVNHASSLAHTVLSRPCAEQCLTTRRVEAWACALCTTTTTAPLPNNNKKLGQAYPNISDVPWNTTWSSSRASGFCCHCAGMSTLTFDAGLQNCFRNTVSQTGKNRTGRIHLIFSVY